MILIDYHQIAYATILEHLTHTRGAVLDHHTARILILDTIRANVKKFKGQYGHNVVIAFDDQHYWRKEIFPYYKHSRKKTRDDSPFDWTTITEILNTLKEEFVRCLPYKALSIHGCEADDIIATLVLRHYPHEKLVIVSGDKDFRQLHIHDHVHQYAPTQKAYILPELPAMAELKRQIIKGDTGDGIPNILSPDNSFVDKIRQKPIYEKKLAVWINQEAEEFCNQDMLKNYQRNKGLIDLREIPQVHKDAIVSAYEEARPFTINEFMTYLSSQRLKPLVEVIDEF